MHSVELTIDTGRSPGLVDLTAGVARIGFVPLFVPGSHWDVYGPRGIVRTLDAVLAGQMEYQYFPVGLDEVAAPVDRPLVVVAGAGSGIASRHGGDAMTTSATRPSVHSRRCSRNAARAAISNAMTELSTS